MSVPPPPAPFDPTHLVAGDVELAIESVKNGKFVVLADTANDGMCSLALAAEHASQERVAFLIRNSCGFVSVAVEQNSGLQPEKSSAGHADGRTGVSATEQAATLRALSSGEQSGATLPGNYCLHRVADGGVLEKPSLAEAARDLCVLAGMMPVCVFATMMQENGSMFTRMAVKPFIELHGFPVISIDELVSHRTRQSDADSTKTATRQPVLDSESKMWVEDIEAECRMLVYQTSSPSVEIVAVIKGDVENQVDVATRVHSECFTGDILGSKRCDCGQQLHKFLRVMNSEPRGVLLYIKGHEGRGIGLANKIRAYKLQDEGFDTVDANLKLGLPVDTREYADSLCVLECLGVKSVTLYTNNPLKKNALGSLTSRVAALSTTPFPQNMAYLTTKRERMNHRTVLGTFQLPPPQAEDLSKVRVGIVYTSWNEYYISELRRVAEADLNEAGVRISRVNVSGSHDLVAGTQRLLRSHVDAVLTLGVLIKGSSDVYEASCHAVITGLTHLNASQNVPVILGLLMCRDEEQAYERTYGANNPAKAWAKSAIHMATLKPEDVGES